jgi:HrpA-like RNA helicase
MHIPGFTHPVQDFMLEDVLKLTGYVPPRKKGGKKSETGNYQIQPSFVDGDEVGPDGDEPDQSQPEEHPASSTSAPISLEERIKRMDVNVIDYDLLALLIQTVLQTKTDDGSILVFLPGVGEIERTERIINQKHSMNSIQVLPLHGGLQPEKQLQVFIQAPKGVTKIILSTNVAETSKCMQL